jgi:hypothetical protein
MLAPVLNPFYNLQKIKEECALLEDHLKDPKERCADCIDKHTTKIKALFAEAKGLDKNGDVPEELFEYGDLAEYICDAFDAGADPEVLAQQVRSMRKALKPVVKAAKRSGLLPSKVGNPHGGDPGRIFNHIPGGAIPKTEDASCPDGVCGIPQRGLTPTEERRGITPTEELDLDMIDLELGYG